MGRRDEWCVVTGAGKGVRLTDGPEVPHKQRLFDVLAHVRHEPVRHQDGRDAAEDHDEEAEPEQAAVRDARDVGLVELAPREDGPDVHEAAEVEQHVDARVDLVVARFGFVEVAAVPVQRVAGEEAGEQVVRAEGAAGADGEELGDVLVNGAEGDEGRYLRQWRRETAGSSRCRSTSCHPV